MTAEYPKSQEEDSAYNDLLAGVANHEAKALTLAYMGTKAEEHYFGADELHSGITAIQGTEPSWIPNPRTPIMYCQLSFEPIGAVAKSQVRADNGRLFTGYALTELGRQRGLALAGATLQWSLEHPDVSVQDVLGTTNSRTANRSPSYRLAVVQSILESEDGVSIDTIVEDNQDIPGLRGSIEQLTANNAGKLFDITTNQVNYNPVLDIVDSEYRGKRPFDSLKLERKAIYIALRRVKVEQGLGTISVAGLIEAACLENPDADPKQVREIIIQGTSKSNGRSSLPAISIADGGRGVLDKGKSSMIRIKDEHRYALEALVEKLGSFERGQGHESLRESARAIVTDEAASRQLMQKAFDFSPKTKAAYGERSVGESVEQVLETTTVALALPEIRQILEQKYDLSVGQRAIYNHIVKLIGAGKLDKEEQTRVIQGRAQKRTYYGPVAKAEAEKK